MNKQEIFDKVVERLYDGTGRAAIYDDDGEFITCAYEDEDGKRCAVGIFIPEGHQAAKCGGGISMLTTNYTNLPEFFYNEEFFLGQLQDAHDMAEHWNENQFNEDGEYALELIADMHSLTFKKPKHK